MSHLGVWDMFFLTSFVEEDYIDDNLYKICFKYILILVNLSAPVEFVL